MLPTAPIWAAGAGVSVIVVSILAGPLVAPDGFDWLRHTTSEQASQHLAGAWIMRTGFVAYGAGTLVAALLDWSRRPWVRAGLIVFAVGLLAAAFWSNAPILPGLAADMGEDRMHSIASGVVGTGFALACVARLLAPGGSMRDGLAWVALAVAVLVPLAMIEFGAVRGLLQRSMFFISFVFVLREFLPEWRLRAPEG